MPTKCSGRCAIGGWCRQPGIRVEDGPDLARQDETDGGGIAHLWILLDEYCVAADSELPASQLIHPRVEPEIALVTRRELQGPGCTIASALAAVDFAVPALEVIDSRYADFKFDLPSVVADNASSARYVVGGSACRLQDIDLRTLGVVVERNGAAVSFGAGAAVLGHPAWSLAMLANLLALREEVIPREPT